MNTFKFTATSCRSRTREIDAEGGKNVILRDDGMRGLILRKQSRDWVVAFEKKIRGKIWRGSLYQYDAQNFNVAAAREVVVQIISEVTAGTYVANKERRTQTSHANDMAVADVVGLHQRANPRLTDTTIRSYRYAAGYLTDGKRTLMRDVTTAYVQAAYERLLVSHSTATANQMVRSTKALWNTWCDEAGADGPNPVSKMTSRRKGTMKPDPKREGSLQPHERAAWFHAAESAAKRQGPTGTAYNALLMLFLTGMRATEILSLRWIDIGPDEFTTTIKGGSIHVRPMTPRLTAVVERQRQFHADSEWVFPARVGDGHMDDLRKAMGNLGVKITRHDLRRTFLGTAAVAMVPDVASKMLVGHTISDITESYQQSIRPQLYELAIKIEDAMLEK